MKFSIKEGDQQTELVISFLHEPKKDLETIGALEELVVLAQKSPRAIEILKAAIKDLRVVEPNKTTCFIRKFEAGKKSIEMPLLATGVARVNPVATVTLTEDGIVRIPADRFNKADGRVIALENALARLTATAAGVEQIREQYCNTCNGPSRQIFVQKAYADYRKFYWLRYNTELNKTVDEIKTLTTLP